MKTINITISRQFANNIQTYLIPYLKLLQQTNLNNVAHCSIQSKEYLLTLIINSLTDELILMINRKLINTTSKRLKFIFSDAVAVSFYLTLLNWPIEKNQFYLNQMRNLILQDMDKELTRNKIYKQGVRMKESVSFDDDL